MKHRYAVFGRLKDFLGEVSASSEIEALAKAKLEWPYAERAIAICPGGDLGVNGN